MPLDVRIQTYVLHDVRTLVRCGCAVGSCWPQLLPPARAFNPRSRRVVAVDGCGTKASVPSIRTNSRGRPVNPRGHEECGQGVGARGTPCWPARSINPCPGRFPSLFARQSVGLLSGRAALSEESLVVVARWRTERTHPSAASNWAHGPKHVRGGCGHDRHVPLASLPTDHRRGALIGRGPPFAGWKYLGPTSRHPSRSTTTDRMECSQALQMTGGRGPALIDTVGRPRTAPRRGRIERARDGRLVPRWIMPASEGGSGNGCAR